MAVAQHDERFAAKVFEGERFCAGAGMVFGQHGEERLGAEREQFKLLVAQRQSEDGQVDGEVAQAFDEYRGGLFDDAELCLRIFFCEGGGVARHEVRRDGGNDAGCYASANVGALVFYAGARGFHLMQDGAGVGQEGASRLSEPDTAAEPIEKLRAEIFFELEHLLGERRLRDVAALGGAAEAARFSDGADVTELVEFHRDYLCSGCDLCIGAMCFNDATFLVSRQTRTSAL